MNRPTVGNLTVPFVVDATRKPIDFKQMDASHVRACAMRRLCGICGDPILIGSTVALIGPDDGRTCFADPWMHLPCAQSAMAQCPFLRGDREWRGGHDDALTAMYPHNMALFTTPTARVHQDAIGAWHFEAVGPLRKAAS